MAVRVHYFIFIINLHQDIELFRLVRELTVLKNRLDLSDTVTSLVNRVDKGSLKSPRELPDGRIVVDAYLTRSGVFEYVDYYNDTIIKEYRPPSEVFKKKSLDSYDLATVTNEHPFKMVDVRNAKDVTVGVLVGKATRDGDFVKAELLIFDKDAILDINQGKSEISCGYVAAIEDKSGKSPDGNPYDVIQRDITINHVAIVEIGRAGRDVKIKTDALYMREPGNPDNDVRKNNKKVIMDKEELLAALKEAKNDQVELAIVQNKLDTLKAEKDKLEADRDSLKEKLDTIEKELPSKIQEAVTKQLHDSVARDQCKVILGESFNEKLDTRTLKVQSIEKVTKAKLDSDKSDEYVSARFDGVVEVSSASTEKNKNLEKVINADTSDIDDEEKARLDMLERLSGQEEDKE